jgi:hypothetical protein
VLHLNLDNNCDHVRIFGAVIGHLEAEIDFEFSIGNGENLGARRDSDKARYFDKSCRYNSRYSTGETPPIQAGRPESSDHLRSTCTRGDIT